MKELKLYLKEKAIYHETYGEAPLKRILWIKCVVMKYDEGTKVELPVINGTVYGTMVSVDNKEVLVAVKETPEELAKNPDIKLIYKEDI